MTKLEMTIRQVSDLRDFYMKIKKEKRKNRRGMTVLELLSAKREDLLRIAERYGARDIRVFGSLARGDAGPESDVDLLVRLDPGVTLFKHAALVRELEALLGRKVDVISERGLRPRVRERLLRDAIPL